MLTNKLNESKTAVNSSAEKINVLTEKLENNKDELKKCSNDIESSEYILKQRLDLSKVFKY